MFKFTHEEIVLILVFRMLNITMYSTLELNEMEPFMKLNFPSKIGLTIFVLLILGFGTVVQKQLISFLKSRSKRLVNKIIYLNLIQQNIMTLPTLFYMLFSLWIENPGEYISSYGCYGMFYIMSFGVILDRVHSFFINMFRYICIVQDEFLKKFCIQPKVSHSSEIRGLCLMK